MKEIAVILSSTWKFAATIPAAIYLFKMTYLETIVCINIGGILGIIIFGLLSKALLRIWDCCLPNRYKNKRNNRPVFTKRSRRFVNIKSKYGLPGIVILTPVVLSIPVGAFLIARYFDKSFKNYFWLFSGLVIWSFIYTSAYSLCKPLLLPLFIK